ncbi:ATP-binding protein [Phaeodactylibacter sp.]|uniref:hybrid sensor histidine kinase/response regulator transcription factor n=1 Tax=Phaeodactylibacter sp. TaxID=1940289 RepID=UPI0025FFF880|nr:ATP-binding protein [Phaeodactylibacter sp.]MCI4647107.1 ATP-binding protein [Phaeodactylibacter sp.]MCI5091065.1 ATP-binding protein [Phaeodactylibacter sp.]
MYRIILNYQTAFLMGIPIKTLILFFSVVLFFDARAQSVKDNSTEKGHLIEVSIWEQEDGLPSWLIMDIIKDRKGALWIATAKGIFRFDGYSFEEYLSTSSSVKDIYPFLAEDDNGNIWVCRQTGKDSFTFLVIDPFTKVPRSVEVYTGSTLPSIRSIGDVFRTKTGIYFFTTQGVWRYKDKLENIANYISSDSKKYYPGPSQTFWKVSLSDSVIQLLDSHGREQTKFKSASTFDKPQFRVDEGLQLWLTSINMDTLVQFTPTGKNIYPPDELEVDNWGNSQNLYSSNASILGKGYSIIGKDYNELTPHQNKYSVVYDGEIIIPDLNKWLSTQYHINLNRQKHYILGSPGVIWLSGIGGLIRLEFSPLQFKRQLYEPDRVASIRQIAKAGPNHLAICTYKGLYLLSENDKLETTAIPISSTPKSVYSNGQSVWVGTVDDLVYQYFPDQDTYRTLRNLDTIAMNEANTFFHLPDQGLVFGSEDGLWKIDSQQSTFSRVALLDTAIYFSHQAQDQYWLGTQYGLYHWNRRTLHSFQNPHQEEDDIPLQTFHLTEDKKGQFWIATNQGLLQWAPFSASYHLYTHQQGLPSGRLHAVYTDREEKLWISSDAGITRFDPHTLRCLPLHNHQGLLYKEFNFLGHYQDEDGLLYLGGPRGLFIFRPEQLIHKGERTLRPIYLDRLTIQGGPASDRTEKRKYPNLPQSIPIPAWGKEIKMDFGFPYYDQTPITFQWRVPGFAEDWQTSNGLNIILRRLPYGTQSLEVRIHAENAPEQLLANSQIELQLAYPIYLRWWFLTLAGLILVCSVRLFIFWRSRQLELKNRQLQKVVDEKTDKIRDQSKKLEVMLNVKNQLFTDISHEFRTPLSLIIGHSRILEKALPQKSEQANSLRQIQNNSWHIKEMIEDILSLTRLQSMEMELLPSICEWPHFFTRLFDTFQTRAAEKHIDFQLHTSPSEETIIFLDQKKVARVINNLIDNVLKFTPANGTVKVHAKKKGQHVFIQVTDTGPGIHPDDLPHIFERYFKGSSKHTGGFGIGLALCKAYASFMQGDLKLESTSPAGSSFLFHFPLSEEVSLSHPLQEFSTPKRETSALPHTDNNQEVEQPHLLIVEDNAEMLTLLQHTLGAEYQLSTAADGQEALSILEGEDSISIVISDIIMPNMNGFELLEKVRATPKLRHLPFLLLTAMSENTAQQQAFNLGVDYFLSKPFEPEELCARINSMVRNIKLRQAHWQYLEQQKNSQGTSFSSNEPSKSYDHLWLKQLENEIYKRLNRPDLKVGDLAIAMHVSERTLRNRVKAYTGLSPSQYLKKIRLQKALSYFENRQYQTISEVCFAVGMQNVSHFSHIFKEEFGVLPSKYQALQDK